MMCLLLYMTIFNESRCCSWSILLPPGKSQIKKYYFLDDSRKQYFGGRYVEFKNQRLALNLHPSL